MLKRQKLAISHIIFLSYLINIYMNEEKTGSLT